LEWLFGLVLAALKFFATIASFAAINFLNSLKTYSGIFFYTFFIVFVRVLAGKLASRLASWDSGMTFIS
jgi:hypothetical protein